jgi:predicted restriction endonuclease
MIDLPYTSHSWTVYDSQLACKVIDKSLLKNNETGIPQDVFHYLWPTINLKPGQKASMASSNQPNLYLEQTITGRYRLKGISTQKHWQIGDNVLIELFNNKSINITHDYSYQSEQIGKTETAALVKVRLKQAKFRENVISINHGKCCVTGVSDIKLLVASHIIPWSQATDNQKVDGNNGLLLSPHVDKLFDRHLISFDENGKLLTSPALDNEILAAWGIKSNAEFHFTSKQHEYLCVHRDKLRNQNIK